MSKKINIVALVPYRIYPAKMGGQKGIALFYEYLSKIIPVSIISTKENVNTSTAVKEYIPLLCPSKFRYINPLLFFSIKRKIKQHHYSHLILEHPYFGWLGLLLKKFTSISLVIHSHNIESLRFKSTGKWWWRILWAYEKRVHQYADINFFITEEDKLFALNHFKLKANACHTITYGFELHESPSSEEKQIARKKLLAQYQLPAENKLLLFNGTLDYKPNLDALNTIINSINPLLLAEKEFRYTILICGKSLPSHYKNLKEYNSQNIIYAGFVEDINLYFKGVDIFLNPVIDGGGIKTKLVEALGHNLDCISTINGAIGVPADITNGKLTIIQDNNWKLFSQSIIQNNSTEQNINDDFFTHFYWGNIAQKAASHLSK